MISAKQALRSFTFLSLLTMLCGTEVSAQYNTLRIPDTLAGPTFNLTMKDTFTQIVTGRNVTQTAGINSDFWGPTLIMNQGDDVNIYVHNSMNDSTTLHWHGMHLPAIMDGGPHQVIGRGATWWTHWKVTNNAATLWYHPHLHEMTMDQITLGLGGLIIVRDSIESRLALPRTYGVDDVPLVLTDRDFDATQQFGKVAPANVQYVPYGDSLLTNGTLRAQYTMPAQVVRFRILNGAIERSYNLGFSDNRYFYVITTDGGLLDTSVRVNRFLLNAGERVEILVNLGSDAVGSSVNLMAYNSTLNNFIPGGENFPGGPFANALGKVDFKILHINVGAATASPITVIPRNLTTNHFPASASADLTRTLTITDSAVSSGVLGPNAFVLEHKLFDFNYISHEVPLNNTEIWELKSTSGFAHPFHIHDVEFYILSRNGVAAPAYEQGWKDVVLVNRGETVRFIAKFEDYADSDPSHPFMYHCHISLHEDEGMMGQFLVTNPSSSVNSLQTKPADFMVFPNPANDRIYVNFYDPAGEAYYVNIMNEAGRAVMMIPRPDLKKGIDVSILPSGVYFIQVTDNKTKQITSKKFVINR